MPGNDKTAAEQNDAAKSVETEDVLDPGSESGVEEAGTDSNTVNGDESADSQEVANESDKDSATEAVLDDVLDFGDARMEPDETAGADLEVDLDPEALKARLEEESSRADGNWERVLRMQADMENQRKRLQKDVENARKFALEAVVNDLLPVKDSLEMGIVAARETDADPEKIIEGTDLTLKMLQQAFEKYNIIEIDPIDQKFDPEFHQAMSMQEVEGKEPNMVTSVLQKGYTLNERLIRPALVMVSK